MKIRKASIKDCSLMAQINISSNDPLNKIFPMNRSQLSNFFKKKIKEGVEFFIYEDKGVIGFIREFPGYKNSEIYWLTVDEKYQNKGIGRRIVRYVEKYAQKKGSRTIYLYTHPIHKKAIRFYSGIGYKKINEFPNYYSNGDKSILFGKKLK